MNLGQMRLEVRSRVNGPGYRFLSDSRINTFINQARTELDNLFLWPYREKAVTGVAPLTIADLGEVEAVTETAQNYALEAAEWRDLLEYYGDLTTQGLPIYYYVGWPAGAPVIATFPVTTDTIGIQYWKTTSDLAADGDSPIAPVAFHYVIVDMATRIALRANRQWEQAGALDPIILDGIEKMVQALDPGNADEPQTYMRQTVAQNY